MSTTQQKRQTSQVRIDAELLRKLKYLAIERETTLSRLVDEAVLMLLDSKKVKEYLESRHLVVSQDRESESK